jgi:hypothetical protein
MFKNARSLERHMTESHIVTHYVALSKIVDTLVKGRPPLFDIDSVHQMETSLSHTLMVY